MYAMQDFAASSTRPPPISMELGSVSWDVLERHARHEEVRDASGVARESGAQDTVFFCDSPKIPQELPA